MKTKYILLNLCLLAAVVLVGWQVRTRLAAAAADRARTARNPIQSAVGNVPPSVPVPDAAPAARFAEVATKDLFARDRNPVVIVEPPKVEKPKDMPGLPVLFGVLGLPGGTRAMMAERSGLPSKTVRAGDTIGEFTVLALNTSTVKFGWEGREIERKVDELIDRGVHGVDAQTNAAAQPGQALQSPISAQPAPVLQGSPIGIELGAPGRSEKQCRPGDSSPAGTVLEGYRKVLTATPFGNSCRWVAAQ